MRKKNTGAGHHRRAGKSSEGPRGPRRENVSELHPVEDPPDIADFEEWPLGPDIQRAIAAMDIVKPTPIQALTIGAVLEGRDVIAKAQTGTGKTLAFGAPMMAKIDAARATVLGLVLCPTRELAQQVHGVIATLGLPRGVRAAMCVGGDPLHPQIAQLQAGAQVVVGTPGRVLDLYQQRFLSFPWTEFVVLDEADKMFEIGFIDDIKKILSYTPEERQTLLFSATFPTEVLKLARESTRNPLEVATASGTVTVDTVEQHFMMLADEDRPMALVRLLEQSGPKDVFLVFCGRRTEVDRLMRGLGRANIPIKALHGGYDQAARFRVMTAFRTGEVKALIATDVASRGLDVQHVTHVINYDVPRDGEDYAHRIGRTGRAGRSGIAITFVTPRDGRSWREVLERTKAKVNELEPPGRTGSRRPPRVEREEPRPPRESEERAPAREEPARPERDERPARSGGGRGRGRARDSERAAPERAAPERSAPERSRERGGRPTPERETRERAAPAEARRESRGARDGARDDARPAASERTRPAAEERTREPSKERAPERSGTGRARGRGKRGEGRGEETRRETPPAAAPERAAQPETRRAPAAQNPRPTARIQDRSPEPGPRRRRRRTGSGSSRPAVDRHDPDGLGRWGNRAEDFD